MEAGSESNLIIKLGYYRLRGRAQVARLIMQYLNIPYQNIFFSSKQEWKKYKSEWLEKYPLLDLPFLIDGDLVLTEAVPICYYIIKKSKKFDLIGRNLKDCATLNMHTWSIDNLGLAMSKLCWMPGSFEKIQQMKARFWELHVKQKIERLEKFSAHKPWMLGYLSLFDFSIYEFVHYVSIIFPKQIQDFKKLLEIQRKIGCLPEIRNYQKSERSVKAYIPSISLIKNKQ